MLCSPRLSVRLLRLIAFSLSLKNVRRATRYFGVRRDNCCKQALSPTTFGPQGRVWPDCWYERDFSAVIEEVQSLRKHCFR
jgi:hypothetical protein